LTAIYAGSELAKVNLNYANGQLLVLCYDSSVINLVRENNAEYLN
jgi:hypothetical protein